MATQVGKTGGRIPEVCLGSELLEESVHGELVGVVLKRNKAGGAAVTEGVWITLEGSWIQCHWPQGAAVTFLKLEKSPHD